MFTNETENVLGFYLKEKNKLMMWNPKKNNQLS